MNYITVSFAAIAGFLFTFLLGFPMIPFLKKLKFGQTILNIGPSWHKSKEGTPTMGGIIFAIPILLLSFAVFGIDALAGGRLAGEMRFGMPATAYFAAVGLALCMGLIGFLDDYIKVVKKRNLGLTVIQKSVLQLLTSAVYLFTLRLGGLDSTWLPWIGNIDVLHGWGLIFWPVALVFIYGFVNAVNLTDGIDGLGASVSAVVFFVFALVSALSGRFGNELLAAAASGSCLGFLIWNMHPAKVFMGDTGSLFLGGLTVGVAFGTGKPVLLLFAGVIYIIEAFSVILQVLYYKKTKKRLFKMSPIHHHFELCGWSENKIVAVFSAVTLLGGLAAMLLFVFC